MLLALPVAFGLLLGKLTGGSFRSLAGAPLRAPWLFVAGFAVQVVLYTRLTDTQSWNISHGHIVYVISLLLLFAGLVMNIRRLSWPLIVVTAGAALNLFVIVVNGGAMPIDLHLLSQIRGHRVVSLIAHHRIASNVTPASSSTVLSSLDDHLTFPFAHRLGVYSLGDVFIGLGGFLLVIAEMRRRRRGATEPLTLKQIAIQSAAS